MPTLFAAYSADSGRPFRLKAATYSDSFRPPCRSEATLVFDILLIRQFPSSFCFFCIVAPFS
jgi:hypothetical protein